MSLLRLGLNPDGTRRTLDLGPERGRCIARGGLPISQALTQVSVKPPKRRIPRQPLAESRRKYRARP